MDIFVDQYLDFILLSGIVISAMTQELLTKKVLNLERQIVGIQTFFGFNLAEDNDLKNWENVKNTAKTVRKEIFREMYPSLYAKLQKKR